MERQAAAFLVFLALACCAGFSSHLFSLSPSHPKRQLLQASHESRARSSAFASAAAVAMNVDDEDKSEQQDADETSTLERRYGSLRPAAVGLLAKVKKKMKKKKVLLFLLFLSFFSSPAPTHPHPPSTHPKPPPQRNSRKCFDSADYALERHAASSGSLENNSVASGGVVTNVSASAASSASSSFPSASSSSPLPLLLKDQQQQQQQQPFPRISSYNSNVTNTNNNNGVLPFAASSTSSFGRMASSTLV